VIAYDVQMRLLVALLLVAASPALGAEACLLPAPRGWGALLGEVPRPGSKEAISDLAIVLWEQRTRTPRDVERAASEEKLSLEDFDGVLGPGLVLRSYPLTEALLVRGANAAGPCLAAAKKAFARPRPYVAEPRVVPMGERERTFSYPSGHATRGALFALILAELVPSRREALVRRGAQIGTDRVVAGVHYPSDVAAGQRLGEAVARALLAEPSFRQAVVEARVKEWAAAR
jgi:membrane-associated phospholipid phosphatase